MKSGRTQGELIALYVFGDTLGAGLAGATRGRREYLDYVTPGILLLAVAGAAQGTAISVAMDMTEGIVNRLRTMAIARVSVLTGHVAGSLIQTMIAIAVVVGLALVLGFRATASPVDWLAAFWLLAMIAFAVIWLAVALGMLAKTVETASNLPMPLILLPFLGSGFVPTRTIPAGMRWFAEYQPFTPIIETLRGLLLGSAIGNSAVPAVAWSLGIGLGGYSGPSACSTGTRRTDSLRDPGQVGGSRADPPGLWPDPQRKHDRATVLLEFAQRVAATGDLDAAQEQTRAALTTVARWLLLANGEFPLSRDELSDQVRDLGCFHLAAALSRPIDAEPCLDELATAVGSAAS